MENSYADVQSCQMKNDEVNFPAKVNLTIDWVCVDWTEESKDKLLSYIIMRYGKMPKEKA